MRRALLAVLTTTALVGGAVTAPAPSHAAAAAPAPELAMVERAALMQEAAIGGPMQAAEVTPSIERWLEVIGQEYLDAYRAGELIVWAAPKVRSEHSESGRAGGIYHSQANAILVAAHTLDGPQVLAHEIGHWLQWRHPERDLIRATERNADAIAAVLLAGTEWAPADVNVTPDEVELAVEVITGRPLVHADPTAVRPTDMPRYEDSYATTPPQWGVRFATAADLVNARQRATGEPTLPAISIPLTLSEARASAAEPFDLEEAWDRLGVGVVRIRDFDRLGYTGTVIDGSVVLDDAFYGHTSAVPEILAAEAGVDSACWASALELAFFHALDAPGVWELPVAERCTVQGLMAAAHAWQGSQWGSGAEVTVPVDGRLADRESFETALRAAGLVPAPMEPMHGGLSY